MKEQRVKEQRVNNGTACEERQAYEERNSEEEGTAKKKEQHVKNSA